LGLDKEARSGWLVRHALTKLEKWCIHKGVTQRVGKVDRMRDRLKRTQRLVGFASLALGVLLASGISSEACTSPSSVMVDVDKLTNRAVEQDRQGEFQLAIADFKQVLDANPQLRRPRYFLANTYWRDNQWVAARREWEILLRQEQSDRLGQEAYNWLKEYDQRAAAPTVTTYVGQGAGFRDGTLDVAQFRNPTGLTIDRLGRLYVADTGNCRIRRVETDGRVVTVAGSGRKGYKDGLALAASLDSPRNVCVDRAGNCFFIDGYRIRFVTPGGKVGTLTGAAQAGVEDGDYRTARLSGPETIAVDAFGNVWLADNGTAIRLVNPQGDVRLVAGSLETGGNQDGPGLQARFGRITAMSFKDPNHLLLFDSIHRRVSELETTTGKVKHFSACGKNGYLDGPLAAAHFSAFTAAFYDDRKQAVYVADDGNHALRLITPDEQVVTLAGGFDGGGTRYDGTGIFARFGTVGPLAVWNDMVYVLDRDRHCIRRVDVRVPEDE
jgi:sugar lactone lactonase YvrE